MMHKKILIVACVLSSFSCLQGVNSKQRKNKNYMARRALYAQLRQKCADFEKPADMFEKIGAFCVGMTVQEDRFQEIAALFTKLDEYGISREQVVAASDAQGFNLLHIAIQHNSPVLVKDFVPPTVTQIHEKKTLSGLSPLTLAAQSCPNKNVDRAAWERNMHIGDMLFDKCFWGTRGFGLAQSQQEEEYMHEVLEYRNAQK